MIEGKLRDDVKILDPNDIVCRIGEKFDADRTIYGEARAYIEKVPVKDNKLCLVVHISAFAKSNNYPDISGDELDRLKIAKQNLQNKVAGEVRDLFENPVFKINDIYYTIVNVSATSRTQNWLLPVIPITPEETP